MSVQLNYTAKRRILSPAAHQPSARQPHSSHCVLSLSRRCNEQILRVLQHFWTAHTHSGTQLAKQSKNKSSTHRLVYILIHIFLYSYNYLIIIYCSSQDTVYHLYHAPLPLCCSSSHASCLVFRLFVCLFVGSGCVFLTVSSLCAP